jgi:amino acid transporter
MTTAPRHRRGGGLQPDVLGGSDSVVLSIAGSAPAYTIAATTATLVGAAGLASPAALIWCGIPMLGIGLAYLYLVRQEAHAGAGYAWVGRALHPILGYLSGWSLVVAATLFMVAGSLPAGSLTLSLISPQLVENTTAVTVVGAGWFLAMVVIVLLGVRVTAHVQWLMTGIEVGILIVFTVLALVRAPDIAVQSFDWSWLGFEHFDGFRGFAAAALVAAFYYWGWDVSANLSEETKSAQRTSGRGGLIGLVIVFVVFESFTIVTNMLMTTDQVEKNSGNLVEVLGQAIWPGVGGKVLSLSVVLSTIATLETTLIQVTRTLYAMGRDRALPAALAWTLRGRRTPWVATLVVAAAAMALFVASAFVGSMGTVLSDAVSAIGLQISVYYSLAGLAVVVAYRRYLFTSVRRFVLAGLWPLAGSLFMAWIFVESLTTLNATAMAIGLGSLGLGLIPMAYYWADGSAYFRTRVGRHAVRTAVAAPDASTPPTRQYDPYR